GALRVRESAPNLRERVVVGDRLPEHPALAAPQVAKMRNEDIEEMLRLRIDLHWPAHPERAMAHVRERVEDERRFLSPILEPRHRHVVARMSERRVREAELRQYAAQGLDETS